MNLAGMRESCWLGACLSLFEHLWLPFLAALALPSKTMAHMWAPAEWPSADTCTDSRKLAELCSPAPAQQAE